MILSYIASGKTISSSFRMSCSFELGGDGFLAGSLMYLTENLDTVIQIPCTEKNRVVERLNLFKEFTRYSQQIHL